MTHEAIARLKVTSKDIERQMTESKLRGHARVTFRAHIALVRTELDQGHTAKTIFDRHKTKLGSMSHRRFLRHIGREITETSTPSPALRIAATLALPGHFRAGMGVATIG